MRAYQKYLPVVLALLFPCALQAADPGVSIDVNLTLQKAFLLQDGKIVYETPISSGRPGHLTPTGTFTVLEKDPKHFSTLYGKMVNAEGKVVDWNADADMAVPKGGKFVPAPMEYFLRFDGANGLHAGIIPGYAASHGCVRLPKAKAILFFDTATVGAPVHVHGTAPKVEPPQHTRPAVATAPKVSPTPVDRRLKWLPFITRLHD